MPIKKTVIPSIWCDTCIEYAWDYVDSKLATCSLVVNNGIPGTGRYIFTVCHPVKFLLAYYYMCPYMLEYIRTDGKVTP